jgi:phytanoyl-CoA hydroxylase
MKLGRLAPPLGVGGGGGAWLPGCSSRRRTQLVRRDWLRLKPRGRTRDSCTAAAVHWPPCSRVIGTLLLSSAAGYEYMTTDTAHGRDTYAQKLRTGCRVDRLRSRGAAVAMYSGSSTFRPRQPSQWQRRLGRTTAAIIRSSRAATTAASRLAAGIGPDERLLLLHTSNAPSLRRLVEARGPVDLSIPQIDPARSNVQLRAQFEAEGFLHIKGLFSPSEVREMERELVHFIEDVLPVGRVGAYYHDESDPKTLFQIDTMAGEAYFDRLMNGLRGESKVNDLVELLFGERAVGLVHFFDRIAGEEGQHDTPPHQDAAYSSQVCTAWVAVDAADEENGCMRYSVGSHLRGFDGMPAGNGGGVRGARPHPEGVPGFGLALRARDYRAEDRAMERAIVAQPGDLIVHHPLLVHRAEPNRTRGSSARRRRAVGCSYFCSADREEYLRINANMHTQR